MTDLFQGSQLPSTTTTTQSQDVAPEFYTNYLQDIANLGQNAVTQGGVAGASPLQTQAFNMAPQTAFAGTTTAQQAADMLSGAGSTKSYDVVGNYMNPYTKNVVDEMSRLQQQNIQRSIMPALASAGVGTGGFGSKRQATATGQTLADMQSNLMGQQYGALSQGYKDALTAAQADLNRQYQAGTGLTSAATEQQNIGQAGLKTLSDLGLTQRGIQQAILDYPMLQTQNFAKLLQGYNIPMGKTTQQVAPGQQGQFTNSPLSQIAGLGALFQAIAGSGGTSGTSSSGTPTSSSITNILNSAGITDATQIQGILSAMGFKSGGSVGYADGGPIQGGLQSMIQGNNQGMPSNLNVPSPGGYNNTNVPVSGYNPPRMVAQTLNDFQGDAQQSSQGGSVGSSDFNPMVG